MHSERKPKSPDAPGPASAVVSADDTHADVSRSRLKLPPADAEGTRTPTAFESAPTAKATRWSEAMMRVMRDDGGVDPDRDPPLSPAERIALYRGIVRSRVIDDRLLKLQRQGRVGFHVGHRGEEAAIVAAAMALREQDWLVPCYREVGAMLFRGAPLQPYIDNMFGNVDDPCKGRQMPDHFHSREYRTLSVSAPIGTQIPHAVGLAHAARLKGRDEVAMVYFGDGATSSNDFHAGMNFAGVMRAPVVFMCRNNQYAISLPSEKQTASETFAQKAVAYGMPGVRVDGNDALAVYAATREAILRASHATPEADRGPTLIELVTYRLSAHSTSDDPRAYRSDAEVAAAEARDPILRMKRHVERVAGWDEPREEAMMTELRAEIRAAIEAAEAKTNPPLATVFEDVYEAEPWHLREQRAEVEEGPRARKAHG